MKFTFIALLSFLPLCSFALTEEEATSAIDTTWNTLRQEKLANSKAALESKILQVGDKKMPFLTRVFGEEPENGHSLYISMHGGGNTRARNNDQQWLNQIRLYEPKEGIYVAPRAPTNTWNLWHEHHIDDLFDQLIAHHVIAKGVNPNKIYLMGYSAGGDGVYQIAPRMADRFAGAAMMAGHPNDASPLGLRNLPFAIYMGGKDGAYKRNEIAAQWGKKLEALKKADPNGYTHRVKIYPEHGHWMKREDAEAVPWMAKFTRDPWPSKIVWVQNGGHLHPKFYWLKIDPKTAKNGEKITAQAKDNTITITTDNADRKSIAINLRDTIVNLDEPITVIVNGKTVHQGEVSRSADVITKFLQACPDPSACPTASLDLNW